MDTFYPRARYSGLFLPNPVTEIKSRSQRNGFLILTIALLVLSILIPGCGGGSSGGSGPSNPAPPSALSYPSPVQATVGNAITPLSPTVTGSVTSFSVSPALPTGLSLNITSGVISGTPTVSSPETTYVITASNVSGSATFGLLLTVSPAVPPPPPNADVSGSWEFVKASHYTEDALDPCAGCFTTGQEELVETVITQQDGAWQGNQTMPITVAFFSTIPNDWNQTAEWVGGLCNGDPGNSSMVGTVSGNAITFTIEENGSSSTGTGTVNADGTISGSYTNTGCNDSGGTFTAHKTDPINGTLANNIFVFGHDPVFTATYNQGPVDSNGVPSLGMFGSDSLDPNFTFSGIAVGNLGIVNGQFIGYDKPPVVQPKGRYGARPRAQYPGKVFTLIVPHANYSPTVSNETLAIVTNGFQPGQAGNDRVAVGVFNEQ